MRFARTLYYIYRLQTNFFFNTNLITQSIMKKIFSLVAVGLLAGSAYADGLAEGSYYIKQASSNDFVTRGQAWGTQGVVEPFGHPWKVTATADGKFKLQMLDLYTQGTTGKGLGDNGYADGANHDVTIVPSENGYVLTVNGKNISVNASNQLAVGTENQTEFQFLSVDQYKAALASATTAQEAAVAEAVGITLGESSLAAYLAENFATKAITTGFSVVPVAGDAAWTFTAGRSGSALGYGSYGIECYQGSGSLTQTISGLKPGLYKVGIKAMQRSTTNAACYKIGQDGFVNSGCYLSANNNVVGINDWYSSCVSDGNPNSPADFVAIANNGGYYSSVYAVVGEDGTLDIKVAFPSFWNPGSWFLFNGIDLTYYMDKSNGLTVYISDFEDLKTTAEGLLVSPMDPAVKAALEAAMATPAETIEAYQAAITALTAAINNAKVSVMKYNNTVGADVTELAAAEWNAAQGEDKEKKAYATGWQTYGETAFQPGKVLYQNIEGLVPGAEYEVSFYAVANMCWHDFATGAGIAEVFANDSAQSINVIAQTGCTPASDEYLHTLKATVGKDGVLQFGIQNVGVGGNWYVAQTKSIISAGNTTVATYATVGIAIDAIRAAIKAASEKIVSEKFADIEKLYQDSLALYSNKIDSVANLADSLFAEVAISGKADSLIALLPTVAQVEGVVANFNAAVVAAQEAYDASHPSAQKVVALPMTYVNQSEPTASYGATTVGETITVGYNKISNGEVAFGNTTWGVNYIGYLNVDITKFKKNVQQIKSAILTLECSGSTDSKRTAGIGIGYNESAWSADMTYETADKSITVIGGQQWTATKSSTVFETLTFDITEALAADADGVMNLLLYNTQAAGAYIKNPVLTVDFYMAPTLKLATIEDFEAKELDDYKADWTIGNADRFTAALQNGASRYFTVTAAGTNGATHTYNKIANTEAYQAAADVVLNFDMAMSSIANSSAQTQSLTVKDAEGNTLVVFNNYTINNSQEIPSPIKNAAGDTIGYFDLSARAAVANIFYRVSVATAADKSVLTVTDTRNDSVVATADLAGGVHVGGLTYGTGKTYGMLALDNINYGSYTYAEIVEDPVFEVIGVAYDTVTVKLATETEEAVIKYTLNGGETLTYADSIIVDSTSVIAAWAEKNGEVSNVVNKTVVACVTPAPALAKAGQTYGADTITITSGIVGGATYYTINGGDTLTYAEPFITDSTITVVAWNVYEGRPSVTSSLNVTAGEIAAPVVTLAKAIDAARQITFATATAAANIVYKLDDAAEVVGKLANDTLIIEKDTKIQVWARYTEGEKVFESAKVDTAFAAGTLNKLAGVEIATVDYSAKNQAADLKVSTSQLEVLLNPAVDIVWAYGDTTGVAGNGDVIKNVPVGANFTAYAKAEGYVTSDTASVQVVPSYASTIFNEDYEDGTVGSWTMQIAGMLANTTAADETHYLHFFQSGQSGGRWAQLVFPEYTSTDYILSFKWGVAAGNGGENVFTVYAGDTEFFHFTSPLDMDTNSGERITTVYAADGSKIGEFGFYLKSRFEWADEKLANVEVAVSEAGVVLTIVNNLGQTQVKAKISDTPVVITKFYETLGRAYGSWRIDDIKIAGRAGSVVAPEFALDHYEVLDPAVAMTDATDKTEIYYRAASTTYSYNDKGEIEAGEYTFPEEFTKYEAPVVLTNEASIVQAYALYDGVVSSDTVLSTVFLRLAEVKTPTVTFASVDSLGVQTFSVKDNTPETVAATMFYQAIGAAEADTLKAATVADSLNGWFKIYAQVGELKSAPVYRYINGAAAYTEPYFGLKGEGELVIPASVGDFEVAVGATVAGEYPTEMSQVAGVQKIHYAVNANYSAMVLPFDITVGTNVITNAEGDTLAAGVDYEVATLHNWTVNRLNGSNISYLVTDKVANVTVREAGSTISVGVALVFKALTDKVGAEVILHSVEKEPVAVEAAVATLPSNGWRVFGNKQYQAVALETPAYVMNAEGTKLVYTENPTVAPLQFAVLVDAKNVEAIGNTIDLFAPVVLADCDLTREMFHEWDTYGANGNIVGAGGCDEVWGSSTGMPYGNGSVIGAQYADLTGYAVLALTVTEGTPRLLLNRQSMDGSSPDFLEINNANSEYVCAVIDGVWYIDIAKITADKGYAHLNVIKGANWANVTITEAKLYGKYPEVLGISNVNAVAELKNGKFIQNGKLFIVREGRIYNAAGAVVK